MMVFVQYNIRLQDFFSCKWQFSTPSEFLWRSAKRTNVFQWRRLLAWNECNEMCRGLHSGVLDCILKWECVSGGWVVNDIIYTSSEFLWWAEFPQMPRELCQEYLTAAVHHRLCGHARRKFGRKWRCIEDEQVNPVSEHIQRRWNRYQPLKEKNNKMTKMI